jgi:hypothetical protein
MKRDLFPVGIGNEIVYGNIESRGVPFHICILIFPE